MPGFFFYSIVFYFWEFLALDKIIFQNNHTYRNQFFEIKWTLIFYFIDVDNVGIVRTDSLKYILESIDLGSGGWVMDSGLLLEPLYIGM